MEILDLHPHLDAKLGVQVGQRLVEEKHARRPHDGPPHRDALPLPSRELAGKPGQELLQTQHLRGAVHRFLDHALLVSGDLETEGLVLIRGHVRIERVILEHHRDIAFLRLEIRYPFAGKEDIALGWILKTRNDAEERCLSTAGRPKHDHELAGWNLEIDTFQDLRPPDVLDHSREPNGGRRILTHLHAALPR